MKTKCKKCGKRFDPEVYSGLCPKCGTYNGSHSSGFSPQPSEYGEAENGAGKSAENNAALEKRGRQDRSVANKIPVLLMLLLLAVPAAGFITFQVKETELREAQCLGLEKIPEVKPEGNKLYFKNSLLKYPISVTAEQAGFAEFDGLPAETAFFVVRARIESEEHGYNFDAEIGGIYLSYETEGRMYYRKPLSEYDIPEVASTYGLTGKDLLSVYSVGGGAPEEGYWLFPVDENAAHPVLLLVLEEKGEVDRALESGTIELKDLEDISFGRGEP